MPPQSPSHATYQPLLAPYFDAVDRQEEALVAAGFTQAAGCAAFTRSWYGAWVARDVDGIIAHVTPDIAFADPGTGGVLKSRTTLREYTEEFYVAVPDLVFYPQGVDVLPYWDVLGEQVRVTLPWRAVGRFSGVLALRDWPRIAPTGRCLEMVGIDRYVLTDDWKIARIDTDYDMLGALQQVGLVPDLLGSVAQVAAAFERLVAAPILRRVA